jgi:hypothetical protein
MCKKYRHGIKTERQDLYIHSWQVAQDACPDRSSDARYTLLKNLNWLIIERELRTDYTVAAKTAKTFVKSSKVLVAWLPRLANAWGRETTTLIYYDAHAKPGDTGDEVRPSPSTCECSSSSADSNYRRHDWSLQCPKVSYVISAPWNFNDTTTRIQVSTHWLYLIHPLTEHRFTHPAY